MPGADFGAAPRMAAPGPLRAKAMLSRLWDSIAFACIVYSFLFSTAAFVSRFSCAFSVEGSASIQRCGMAS